MHLRISFRLLSAMRQHAEATFPHECCGFLLGNQADTFKEIKDLLPATNEHSTWKERRFSIAPQAYIQAEKQAERNGQEILGFYHSHPDYPAQPSQVDLEHAWPECSYAIISVEEGRAVDVASWLLPEGGTEFRQEQIEVLDEQVEETQEGMQ